MLCVHVTACADRWIALKEPVLLQGTNFPKLIMKLRFFFKDPLEITDPLAQRLYFMQVCPPRTDREVRMRRGGGDTNSACRRWAWLRGSVHTDQRSYDWDGEHAAGNRCSPAGRVVLAGHRGGPRKEAHTDDPARVSARAPSSPTDRGRSTV